MTPLSRELEWSWSESYVSFSRMLRNGGLSTDWVRGGRCLDVGCGDGQNMAILAFLNASKIVGVDRDLDRIRPSKRLLHTVPSAAFVQADAAVLPFPNATFDCIICLRVLHHAQQPELIVAELRRVLAPGGSLFLHQN